MHRLLAVHAAMFTVRWYSVTTDAHNRVESGRVSATYSRLQGASPRPTHVTNPTDIEAVKYMHFLLKFCKYMYHAILDYIFKTH